MFASHVQEALRNVLKENVPPRGQRELTWREKECLLWTAEGKTAWEIAQIINISRRTVVYHLRNAMIKLDATNRTQAAVNAFPHLCLDVEALRRSTNFGELVAVHVVTSEENS
ncbi:helix-turn-helix domain-containing protein [Aquisalimonas lutea]|uniref:helix-turn-helix domain-containing protein n=1 Tax=Aquisalimonas lutea TaxID=1327750 RepID=UPI0033905E58